MTHKPAISLQLWSARESVAADFAGTIGQIASMGFTGVETAGLGNVEAEVAARVIEGAGLSCSGMHVGLAALRSDLTKVAAEAHILGTRNVICPYFPRTLFRSAAACTEIGEEIDAIGARLRAYGLKFHYHHHGFELTPIDGRCGLDWVLDAAAPRNVLCEADVYWLKMGGKDPAEFLREQGRRVQLLHLRDERELGSGPVDFPSVFAAAEAVGAVEWYVIEIGNYSFPPLESVRRSFDQLAVWGRG